MLSGCLPGYPLVLLQSQWTLFFSFRVHRAGLSLDVQCGCLSWQKSNRVSYCHVGYAGSDTLNCNLGSTRFSELSSDVPRIVSAIPKLPPALPPLTFLPTAPADRLPSPPLAVPVLFHLVYACKIYQRTRMYPCHR